MMRVRVVTIGESKVCKSSCHNVQYEKENLNEGDREKRSQANKYNVPPISERMPVRIAVSMVTHRDNRSGQEYQEHDNLDARLDPKTQTAHEHPERHQPW